MALKSLHQKKPTFYYRNSTLRSSDVLDIVLSKKVNISHHITATLENAERSFRRNVGKWYPIWTWPTSPKTFHETQIWQLICKFWNSTKLSPRVHELLIISIVVVLLLVTLYYYLRLITTTFFLHRVYFERCHNDMGAWLSQPFIIKKAFILPKFLHSLSACIWSKPSSKFC